MQKEVQIKMMNNDALYDKIVNGEDVDFREFLNDAIQLRQIVMKYGSPMTNLNMIKALELVIDDFSFKQKLKMPHYQKILESKDKEANLKCYIMDKNRCGASLEVLNDKQDKKYYKRYLQEKVKLVKNENDAYELNKSVLEFGDVGVSRDFLSKVNKLKCEPKFIKYLWYENLSLFTNLYKEKGISYDANDAIWILTNIPEDIEIASDDFDLLEDAVLNSKDGSYNLFFMMRYPNVNFRKHEKALLDSKCGMTISTYARDFSKPNTVSQKSKYKNKEFADIDACAKAIVQSNSESAMYVFANEFGYVCNIENMISIYKQLASSNSEVFKSYGAIMLDSNIDGVEFTAQKLVK